MFIEPFTKNRPIGANCFHIVFNLIGALVFALIVYGTWFKFQEAWPDLKFGVEDEFTILVWPLRVIILFGSILVSLKYLIQLADNITQLVTLISDRKASRNTGPTGLPYFLIIIFIGIAIYGLTIGDFTKIQIGAISFIGVLIVIFTGIHIGVGLIFLGFTGTWIMMDNPNIAFKLVKLASNEFLRNYFFAVVPLFVMMGLLVNESNIGKDTFDAARWALKKVKGGLGVATVIANAVFAAITGSSIASAAVFTKVAVPQMLNHGYTARFAVGTVAGSSVLGMLIPPSLLLIIYGLIIYRIIVIGNQTIIESNVTLGKNCVIGSHVSIKNTIVKLNNVYGLFQIILDSNNKLVGTLTDGDIRRAILNGKTLNDSIGDIFNSKPRYL